MIQTHLEMVDPEARVRSEEGVTEVVSKVTLREGLEEREEESEKGEGGFDETRRETRSLVREGATLYRFTAARFSYPSGMREKGLERCAR